jgi:hypothetical protein
MTRGTTRGCHRWNFIYNIGRTDLSIKYKNKLFWSCYKTIFCKLFWSCYKTIFFQIILVLLQDHFFFANYFGLVTRPFFFQIILVLLQDHFFFANYFGLVTRPCFLQIIFIGAKSMSFARPEA